MKKDKKNNLVERIYLSKNQCLEVEKGMLLQEHLRRYGTIRRFCYGKVLDFACGCGYGSYLLAGNPDVNTITAIDHDNEAVAWAEKEFSHPKITFSTKEIHSLHEHFDTLVCLETIEHLKDPSMLSQLIERCTVDNIIVSFPDKKTTHYNPYHLHDYVRQDIIDIFTGYLLYHSVRFMDSNSLMFIRLPKTAPSDIFRNIKDLH